MSKALAIFISIIASINFFATKSFDENKEQHGKIERSKVNFEQIKEKLEKVDIASRKFSTIAKTQFMNSDVGEMLNFFVTVESATSEISTFNRIAELETGLKSETKYLDYPENELYIRTVYGEEFLKSYKEIVVVFEKQSNSLKDEKEQRFFQISVNVFKDSLPKYLFEIIKAKELHNKIIESNQTDPINIPLYLNVLLLFLAVLLAYFEFKEELAKP